MELSQEEEQMINGVQGAGVRKAMELVVAMGEAYGAERLIKVASAHLLGPDIMLWTTGQLGKWARELVDDSVADAKSFKVRTTINPIVFDPDLLKRFGYPKDYVDDMRESITRGLNVYRRLGIVPTYSCCPFFLFPPRKGEHIATAETTVQLMSNSIFGARVNRESGPTALASALTGRTALYGMHLSENRLGNALVKLKDNLDLRRFTDADYSVLSLYTGGQAANKIPVYTGLRSNMSITELLWLAHSHVVGALPLFHIEGVTPEAPTLEAAFGGRKPEMTIEVGRKEMRATFESLWTATDEKIDWVLMGCPHSTMEQIREVAGFLEGKKLHDDVKLIMATNEGFRALAKKMGLVDIIQKAGGFIISECPIEFPRWAVPPGYRIGVVATNSAGSAWLLKGRGIKVWFGSIEKCVKAAIKGRWEVD